jgi:hypothetical protein
MKKKDKLCTQLAAYFKRHMGLRSERAAGETETTQENIPDWLKLDEGGPGFQLLIEK